MLPAFLNYVVTFQSHQSVTFRVWFLIGFLSGLSSAALLVATGARLVMRRYRLRLGVAIDVFCRVVCVTAIGCLFTNLQEVAEAWFSANAYERFTFFNSRFGSGYYAWVYWLMVFCQYVLPQLYWVRRCRRSRWGAFVIALVTFASGYWERFVIIVTSFSEDFLPSSWHVTQPPIVRILQNLPTAWTVFFVLFLVCVWGFGAANAAQFITGIAGLFLRRWRRRYAAAAEALSRVLLAANVLSFFMVLCVVVAFQFRRSEHGAYYWFSLTNSVSYWIGLMIVGALPHLFWMRRYRVHLGVILAITLLIFVLITGAEFMQALGASEPGKGAF